MIPGRIVIDRIPHRAQRYDTCGDYQIKNGYFVNTEEKVLHITVSATADRREGLLIAIHELIEWALCETAGVQQESIDQFDIHDFMFGEIVAPPDITAFEPGDHPKAPYYKQHQIATGIERLLAAEMGVDWLTYESHIKELSHV